MYCFYLGLPGHNLQSMFNCCSARFSISVVIFRKRQFLRNSEIHSLQNLQLLSIFQSCTCAHELIEKLVKESFINIQMHFDLVLSLLYIRKLPKE